MLLRAIRNLDRQTRAGGGVNEMVIIRNGRMIWEGPESDAVHPVHSVTKSFATTTLGLLIDDGLVTIDTLAKDYVSSMATDYPEVTLGHLATHTSGYRPAGEPYPLPANYDWTSGDPFTPGPPHFTPGSRFSYSPHAMEQMTNVLTRVAGEPMQDFFQRRIGDPIGLDMSAWDWEDKLTSDGLVVDAGGWGISMSTKETARLGHLFLNEGNWEGQQLVSSEWVETATSVQVPVTLAEHPNSYRLDLAGIYGYGWWVNGVRRDGTLHYPGVPPKMFSAAGYLSNFIFVIPEWNMVVTRGGTSPTNAPFRVWSDFLGAIGSALFPANNTMAFEPAAIYSVADDDGDTVFDDRGDTATDPLLLLERRFQMALGEQDTATDNRVTRLIAKFHLPGMPNAAGRLESATLRFYLDGIDGTPAGPVSLWHGGADNDSDAPASDYENASYTDTLLDLMQPTDTAPGYHEVDVTSLVLADYAADDTNQWVSAFRLQIDETPFLENNLGGSYQIALPRSANPPELVLTFAVPEPSSISLVLMAVVGLHRIRQQHRNRWRFR